MSSGTAPSGLFSNRATRRRATTYLAFVVASVLLMGVSGNPFVRDLENGVAFAFRPIEQAVGGVAGSVQSIGSAYPGEWDQQRVNLRGRDLLTGLPRSVEVGADQVREAIEPSVVQIVDTIRDTIEETPPELVADIMDQGIVLAGGGALLAGLDRRVAEATQMPVHVADDPLTCVVRGTGEVLEDLEAMQRVLVTETYSRPLH